MAENPYLHDERQDDDKALQPVDVLYILGPGHCGSALLKLCLDRNSRAIAIGSRAASVLPTMTHSGSPLGQGSCRLI